jgi:hypothetical protein
MNRYFNTSQISVATWAFPHAEKLTAQYFRLNHEAMKSYRYDVKTLAYLEDHEVNEQAFAHLCKYQYNKGQDAKEKDGFYFYRICLQDNRILDAVERANSFIKLNPLMLYIAAHELVHVLRFEMGESDFEASLEEKKQEEERVNAITKDMLQAGVSSDLNLVLDCFSDRYKIGDLFN